MQLPGVVPDRQVFGLVMSGVPRYCACREFVDVPDFAQQVAIAAANMGESLAPVIEAVNGYRSKLLGYDYPAAIAARMAADYHALLLTILTPGGSTSDEGGNT